MQPSSSPPKSRRSTLVAALVGVAAVASVGAALYNSGYNAPAAAPQQAAAAAPAVLAAEPRRAAAPAAAPKKDNLPRNVSAALEKQILGMLDTSVDPCDDFYQFSCGAWLNRTQLNGQQEVVASFTEIGEIVQKEVSAILQEKYPFVQKFASVCLENQGASIQSLRPSFNQIDTDVVDSQTMLTVAGSLQRQGLGYGAVFQWTVQQNIHDARTNELFLQQDGLSFPAYGLDEFPVEQYTSAIRPAFDILARDGIISDAQGSFDNVLAAEKWLFSHQPNATVNFPVDVSAVKSVTRAELFQASGVDVSPLLDELSPERNVTRMSVVQPESMTGLLNGDGSPFLTPAVARDYLKWRVVYGALWFLPGFDSVAANMSETLGNDGPYAFPWWPVEITEPQQMRGPSARVPREMRAQSGQFHRGQGLDLERRAARGAKVMARYAAAASPREELCQELTSGLFSTWYMHQYLVQDFPTFDRDLADRLVNDTITHLKQRLETVVWLDETTRAAALEKLSHLVPNVATDPFKGTAGLAPDWTAPAFDVFANIAAWRFNRTISMAMTEYDRSSYQGPAEQMPPWVQNAYYQPTSNTINMLPGLMLPPMFSTDLPYSLNVAAYVMVIGHECTHGYDNTGRLFGPYGAYENWWTNTSIAQFNERTTCLVNQYSAFEKYGVHVIGEQTLGENIADGGGVDMAWSVYKSITPAPEEGMVKGFTNDQLHFLYYAQTWCTKETEAAYKSGIENDVHSPDEFRIRGPLSNFKPFAKAFQCKPSQYYGRSLTDKACVVW